MLKYGAAFDKLFPDINLDTIIRYIWSIPWSQKSDFRWEYSLSSEELIRLCQKKYAPGTGMGLTCRVSDRSGELVEEWDVVLYLTAIPHLECMLTESRKLKASVFGDNWPSLDDNDLMKRFVDRGIADRFYMIPSGPCLSSTITMYYFGIKQKHIRCANGLDRVYRKAPFIRGQSALQPLSETITATGITFDTISNMKQEETEVYIDRVLLETVGPSMLTAAISHLDVSLEAWLAPEIGDHL